MTNCDKVPITYRKLSGVFVEKIVLFCSLKHILVQKTKKVRRSSKS